MLLIWHCEAETWRHKLSIEVLRDALQSKQHSVGGLGFWYTLLSYPAPFRLEKRQPLTVSCPLSVGHAIRQADSRGAIIKYAISVTDKWADVFVCDFLFGYLFLWACISTFQQQQQLDRAPRAAESAVVLQSLWTNHSSNRCKFFNQVNLSFAEVTNKERH